MRSSKRNYPWNEKRAAVLYFIMIQASLLQWLDPYGWTRMTRNGFGLGFCNPELLFSLYFSLKRPRCAQTQRATWCSDPDRGKRVCALRRAAAECAWQMPPRGTEQRQALQKAFLGPFPGASPSWQRRFILTSHGCLRLRLLAQPIWGSCHVGLRGEQDGGRKRQVKHILGFNTSICLGNAIKSRLLCPHPGKTFVEHLEGGF